jgi:hypothetical protein
MKPIVLYNQHMLLIFKTRRFDKITKELNANVSEKPPNMEFKITDQEDEKEQKKK